MRQGEKTKGIENYNNAVANRYDDTDFFSLGLFYEEEGNGELDM